MDVNLWEGGQAFLPDCGECKVSICPAPHRMAAHRRRAPYNMGGAFDYQCDVVNRVCYDLLTTGDTVWIALVPEDSLLEAIRILIRVPDATNVLTFTVVAEVISLEDCGASVTTPLAFAAGGPHTSAALFANYTAFAGAYTAPFVPPGGPETRQGVRVGIQMDVIPAGGLAAFMGRIEVTVVASDFETVQIADCRANGPCIIDNP